MPISNVTIIQTNRTPFLGGAVIVTEFFGLVDLLTFVDPLGIYADGLRGAVIVDKEFFRLVDHLTFVDPLAVYVDGLRQVMDSGGVALFADPALRLPNLELRIQGATYALVVVAEGAGEGLLQLGLHLLGLNQLRRSRPSLRHLVRCDPKQCDLSNTRRCNKGKN